MTLERMICRECGAEFDDDLFGEDPSETIVCPQCGTVALDAIPIEDRHLHVHHLGPPTPMPPLLI